MPKTYPSNFDEATIYLSNEITALPFNPPQKHGYSLTSAVWINATRESLPDTFEATNLNLVDNFDEKIDEVASMLSHKTSKTEGAHKFKTAIDKYTDTSGGMDVLAQNLASAGASLSNKLGTSTDVKWELENLAISDISHGTHLVNFLRSNLPAFIQNHHKLSSKIFKRNKVTRSLLGFVSVNHSGVLSASVGSESHQEDSATVHGGTHGVDASATLSTETGQDRTISCDESFGVVGVQLLVYQLQTTQKGQFDYRVFHLAKVNDHQLKEAQCWLIFADMFRKSVKNIFSKHPAPAMESFGYVFANESTSGILGDNFMEQRGNVARLPHGLDDEVVLDDSTGAAVLCFGRVENTGEISFTEGKEKKASWTGSIYELIEAPLAELIELEKRIGEVDKDGVCFISMRAAFKFKSTHFAPVTYQGVDDDAPSMLLRVEGHFEYMFPVEGGSKGLVAYYQNPAWRVNQDYEVCAKGEQDKIDTFIQDGCVGVEPSGLMLNIEKFDEDADCLLVRQTLEKERGAFIRESDGVTTTASPSLPSDVTQSNTGLDLDLPDQKKQKTGI